MKPFAIYFPQFYPTPTNDAAWGQGFTDWTLVADANLRDRWPRRAPTRGFYDGSRPELHRSQMQQMRDFGLGGLALYHYWFYSHQELDAFERTMLQTRGTPALPWYLIWATEGWSRRWLGDSTPIATLSTRPDRAQVEAHCDYLARCFDHPTYLRWKGRPLFIWYHLAHFERPGEVIEQYREALCRRNFDTAFGHFAKNPFDVQHSHLTEITYLFEPRLFFGTQRVGRGAAAKGVFDRIEKLIGEKFAGRLMILLDRLQQSGTVYTAEAFLNYLSSSDRHQLLAAIPGDVQEVLSPGWNNTPRYGTRFTALQDVPADRFGELVRRACADSEVPPLINAWNEWSEGAAIEPCTYLGTRYLDSFRAAGESVGGDASNVDVALSWGRL